jgi:hypothetical protein
LLNGSSIVLIAYIIIFSLISFLDGGVVSFGVYLEQPAFALKLTEPALQLLVVHVLERPKQFPASHRLVLLNPVYQFGLSAPFHSFFGFPQGIYLRCVFSDNLRRAPRANPAAAVMKSRTA